MTSDEYLTSILQKYTVNISKAKDACQTIYPLIEHWGNEYLKKCEFSGSLAKGTGISIGTDADIFISLSSTTPGTLAEIYQTLYATVTSAGYVTQKRNVSINTKINGCAIDLVPGRRQSQYGGDHSLYLNRSRTWTKTNVEKHIAYVKNSSRIDEIKILKVWRQIHQLEFSSFFLEMTVIDALTYARIGNLAGNVLTVLDYIKNNIQSVRYIDPANTNNIVSNDCTLAEKSAIATQAANSCSQQVWERIVW